MKVSITAVRVKLIWLRSPTDAVCEKLHVDYYESLRHSAYAKRLVCLAGVTYPCPFLLERR